MKFWKKQHKYVIRCEQSYDYLVEVLARRWGCPRAAALARVFTEGVARCEQDLLATMNAVRSIPLVKASSPLPTTVRQRGRRLRCRRGEALAMVYAYISRLAFPASFARWLMGNGWCWLTCHVTDEGVFLVFAHADEGGYYEVMAEHNNGGIRRASVTDTALIATLEEGLGVTFERNTTHLALGKNISLNKSVLRFKVTLLDD